MGADRSAAWARARSATRASNWKSVNAAGLLTIVVAGYSVPKGAPLAILSDIPARRVKPCTAQGGVLILPHQINPHSLWKSRRTGQGEGRP